MVCSFLILFSCNYKSRNAEQSSTDKKLSECKLDTSINEFSLMNPVSLDSIFMRQVDNCKVNDFQYGEGFYISNASDNEFVFMKFNCGRIGEEFEAFILTDSIFSEYSSYKIHSNIPKFISTNGAYLGMSKADFMDIYFNDNELKIRFDSKYIQYDSINLLYNKYFFRNDTLRKIEIGYDW